MRTTLISGLILAAAMALCVTARAADWQTDFQKASAEAKSSGKYMLLDFSGSDWCGWCMKLEKEVFSKSDFKSYAKENLVCVLLDFPQKKKLSKEVEKQNATLAAKYAVRGYPTVIVLSPEGELVGKTGYQRGGPEKYVENLKKMIDEFKTKKKPAAAPQPAAVKKPDVTKQPAPTKTAPPLDIR